MRDTKCLSAGGRKEAVSHDLALTVKQASAALNLAPNTIYMLAAQRKIPVLRIRGTSTIRIPLAALQRWIAANTDGEADSRPVGKKVAADGGGIGMRTRAEARANNVRCNNGQKAQKRPFAGRSCTRHERNRGDITLYSDYSNFEQPRQKLAERLPCPVHDGRDPNVSVWTDEHGRLRATCHSRGCPEAAILRALGEAPLAQRTVTPKSPSTEPQRIARAPEAWSRTEPAPGTLAELYLQVRGITIPTPSSLRYDPHTRHPTGVIVPTLVAAITREKEIVGIQRTFLRLDKFGKAALHPSKICFGVVRGGCVRLARAAETLVLCEGIETALSVMQATGLPTWASLGAGNLAHVVLPETVRAVVIGADNDVSAVGQRAAYQAADRFITQGRKVRIALPPRPGQDFNDLLREGGAL